MYACITRETFVFTDFQRVFHLILKLELINYVDMHVDVEIKLLSIPTCRYGKNMPTTALVLTFGCQDEVEF